MVLQHYIPGDRHRIMAYLKQEVLLYKQSGTDFSDTPTTITDAYNIKLDMGKADRKDVFKFNIRNPHDKYSTGQRKFEEGDNVKIRMWKNAATYALATSNNRLLFDGIITEPNLKVDTKGHILEMKGSSRTELMFGSLVFVSLQGDDAVTLPGVIKHIIDEVNGDNLLGTGSAKKIKYIYLSVDQDGNATTDDDTISNVKSDGTAYTSKVQLREIYRKGIEILKKYSSSEWTADGNYEYYLDQDNYFHWKPKIVTLSDGDSLNEGVNARQISIKVSKADIITGVIINVGMSPSNRGNTIPVINPVAVTQHGAKWKFISRFQNLSETIMSFEEVTNNSSFNTNQDRFPISYGGAGYTTAFVSSATFAANSTINLPAATKGSPITVSSDSEYDAVIRREAEFIGQRFGQALLDTWSNPRFEAKVNMPLTNEYTTADLIPHTVESFNFDNKNLRLSFTNHMIWGTESDSLEDETDAGEN